MQSFLNCVFQFGVLRLNWFQLVVCERTWNHREEGSLCFEESCSQSHSVRESLTHPDLPFFVSPSHFILQFNFNPSFSWDILPCHRVAECSQEQDSRSNDDGSLFHGVPQTSSSFLSREEVQPEDAELSKVSKINTSCSSTIKNKLITCKNLPSGKSCSQNSLSLANQVQK